jgi:hypothetical protein
MRNRLRREGWFGVGAGSMESLRAILRLPRHILIQPLAANGAAVLIQYIVIAVELPNICSAQPLRRLYVYRINLSLRSSTAPRS